MQFIGWQVLPNWSHTLELSSIFKRKYWENSHKKSILTLNKNLFIKL